MSRESAAHVRRQVAFACAVEGGLLLVAVAVAYVVGVPVLADLHWSVRDLAGGLAATVPMLAVPWWAMRSRLAPVARLREVLDRRLLPLFAQWPAGALVLVALVAGTSEEVFFRAVIQGGLAESLGPVPALLIASVLFGAAHWITPAYAAVATAIGLWLGGVWILTGNLLVPIVAHSAYDAVVLVWLVPRARR